MPGRRVRIGGACGAWGDSPRAIPQLLRAPVDYLIMDYLAEVSMSLLARARMKSADGGYPADFIAYLKDSLPELARRGIKVVTNAGGVDPRRCKSALESACRESSVSLCIAAVVGDDLMPLIEDLRRRGVREAVSGEELPRRLLTANAYLGALPIAAALAAGADVVITGRCADSALALGILVHEFGWKPCEFDLLAAGSLAGHLLECGAQGTGGLHTDWEKVPDWENIGYPIAECRADGSFILTKPQHTGGLVIPGAVAEQVLYEVGDPASYVLPDVVADFSRITLAQAGADRVLVTGARGRAPTREYKVSATYQDGYRAVASVSIVGPDAVPKAERTAQALIGRARLAFREQRLPDFTATHVEVLGAETSYGPGSRTRHTREVLLRVVVTHQDAKCLELFARELGSAGISFAPGTTGIYGGRPKPTPLIKLLTFFVDKTLPERPRVLLGTDELEIPVDVPPGESRTPDTTRVEPSSAPLDSDAIDEDAGDTVEVPLARLALARSGDKGDTANIAVIARDPAYVPTLRRELTAERVLASLAHLVAGPAQRFEAPGLHAFNFLLQHALGGGGMASLRIDPQGKAYAPMALEIPISVPTRVLRQVESGRDV
jgi:hypothetical protein